MRRQIAIAGAGLVVVLALVFVFLIRPVSSQIAEVKEQTETARSQESSLRVQLRALQQARANATEVAARLAKFDLLLPRTSDIPAFIRQVQDAANLSGITLSSIAPSPPSALAAGPGVDPVIAGKGVFGINVVLQVAGGFFRLESFLQRLENLQRVVMVNNMSISPTVETDTGLFTLNSTITLQMFVVNPNLTTGGVPPSPAPTASPAPSPTGTPTGQGGAGGPATPAPTPS
ncbi:MAG TPA: type 4a pilus biogenesis protein PilO [Actinomycetota bacterium]|nr:type 4a pilus biogenesis protein PilO [Actinomycetota bacterium]